MPDAIANPQTPAPRSFWQRKVVDVVVGQLKQGITAEKVSLTIALGVTVGLFPLMGTTTILCGATAFLLKLNQPIIQLINWLIYPAQIAMIIVFARIGEWIMRAQPVSLSISNMVKTFKDSPAKFFQEFGMTGVHAIVAWLVIGPFIAAILYFIFLPIMRKLSNLNKPTTNHVN